MFIDARKLGTLFDRVHRELTDVDISKIVNTYRTCRGDAAAISNLKSEISNLKFQITRTSPASANPPRLPKSPHTVTS